MEEFDNFFGVELGRKCLSMVDNLTRMLQAATISTCEGQVIVKKTVQSFQSIRNDEHIYLFWKYLENRCSIYSHTTTPNESSKTIRSR